jgi:hypothetical protein
MGSVPSVPSVQVVCAKCGTLNVVVPPTLGQPKAPEFEPGRVSLPDLPEGARLAQADEQGSFSCAKCHEPNEAPELRLS